MMLVLICLLTGMALGQRFKVLVLAPALALVVGLSIVVGVAHADPVWLIISIAVGAMVSLQIGYLLGTGIGVLLVGVRARRTHATHLGSSSPTGQSAR
jgi:hypothetical protein